MTPRPWAPAARSLAWLGPFFFLSYGAATWITSLRAHVGSIVFGWEHGIPFLPWTIVPYWSIDVLYGISLFVCTSRQELSVHVRRLLTAQIAAVTCFLLFPLTFTFHRPPVQGFSAFLFGSLEQFDKPFNQAPSLHIALLVILWVRYGAHISGVWRLLLHAWFALIGVSVLTTWQHHFFDIPAGALLGFLCLFLWPDRGPSPLAGARWTGDPKRRRIALVYALGALLFTVAAAAMGNVALWLLWPAVSLMLLAANYAWIGAAGFQKAEDGSISLAAAWLLAPVRAAAWMNAWLWTRGQPDAAPVAAGVFLGRLPVRPPAFAAVIDLCAELPGQPKTGIWHARPMLDLIAPAPDALREAAALIEHARAAGPVLVCCALGYGRSAAAMAAWLLSTGRAADIDAAYAIIRQARAGVVLRADTRAALKAAS